MVKPLLRRHTIKVFGSGGPQMVENKHRIQKHLGSDARLSEGGGGPEVDFGIKKSKISESCQMAQNRSGMCLGVFWATPEPNPPHSGHHTRPGATTPDPGPPHPTPAHHTQPHPTRGRHGTPNPPLISPGLVAQRYICTYLGSMQK